MGLHEDSYIGHLSRICDVQILQLADVETIWLVRAPVLRQVSIALVRLHQGTLVIQADALCLMYLPSTNEYWTLFHMSSHIISHRLAAVELQVHCPMRRLPSTHGRQLTIRFVP